MLDPLNIVLDTNIIISGTVFGGMSEGVIDLVVENNLHLFISDELTKEVVKKLNDFQASESIVSKAMILLRAGELITPNITITACRDPKDNYLLELAETAAADFIITRDKDLLELPNQSWKDTKIMKPEDFLPLLRSKKVI